MSQSNQTPANSGQLMQQAAEQIFSQVHAAGAEADLIIDRGESLSLKANQGELEEHKVSSSQIFGVRVVKEGRVGTAYSEADDAESLHFMVGQALTNSNFATPEPEELITHAQGELCTDDNLLCPEETAPIEAKIQLVLDIERELLARPNIHSVPYNQVYSGMGERHLFTSHGFYCRSRARTLMAYAYPLAADGEKNAMALGGQIARRFDELDSEFIVREAFEKSTGLLDGAPVTTGHYDVIFDAESQADLLGIFFSALSGKSAKDGISPWRDQVGKPVADSRIQLIDCPLRTDGFGYTLFDAEGTACQDRPLISGGVLHTLLHNSVTATHFGVANTGHAARGPKSGLGVGAHQLCMAPGGDAAASLLAGEYLEITSLDGLHSGANPTSGDFSFGASGYLCREGVRQRPVRGITVAGNFYQMLKRINAIGDTAQWNMQKSSCLPALRFADIAVSGS